MTNPSPPSYIAWADTSHSFKGTSCGRRIGGTQWCSFLFDHLGLHSYETDTCSQGHAFEANKAGDCANCETGKDRDLVEDAADFRALADHIISLLNPPTPRTAETLTCMDAVSAVTGYVESLRCRCTIKADGSPCPRCLALGRHHDEKVQR
jgi:hypothetical protein